MIIVLQTPLARHIENHLYGGARLGDKMALCSLYLGADPKCKVVALARIPAAAVCPDCVRRAREWYAPRHFEPFDGVQRQRLLDNLERDLDAVA